MKWFKHYSDTHTNKKGRQILRNQGLEGYAIWWICREMVAKEGKNFRLKAETDWKKTLSETAKKDETAIDKILKYHASINAINHNALEKGDLWIPKLKEYGDEYSDKLRRVSGLGRDNIRVDKTILDKIRLEYIRLKGWDEKNLIKNDYSRIHGSIKNLLLKSKGDVDYALRSLQWAAATFKNKGFVWTMETVVKWFPEFYKQYPLEDKTSQQVKKLLDGIGTEK